MSARREVEIEASPEEVWRGARDRRGARDLARRAAIARSMSRSLEEPSRLVWWWRGDEHEPATRVEFVIASSPGGARVIVTESEPAFPISMLARGLAPVALE